MRPTMVMHAAKPELNSKDATEIKDPTGKRVFVEFVTVVKASGAGFVFYLWPKPGSDNPVKKVSYVKGFEPWGWVLGSGVYIDTVDATFAQRCGAMSLGTGLLAALLLAIGVVVARSLLVQLGGEPTYATQITTAIVAGDLSAEIKLKAGIGPACFMPSSRCVTASV